MMKQHERFNHLIDFDIEYGLITCEKIIREMDEIITFDHDDVVKINDREDKTHEIRMRFRADDDLLKCITDYLDCNGFRDQYSVYNIQQS